jgi:hypothetical protein
MGTGADVYTSAIATVCEMPVRFEVCIARIMPKASDAAGTVQNTFAELTFQNILPVANITAANNLRMSENVSLRPRRIYQ